ncbi:MAG: energy transducer TonB, partial [Gemmatimonadaceae bacterium]
SALILSVSASIMWPTPTSTLIVRGFPDLGQMPLVRMRVPKREVTQKVVADFGNRPPPYPFGMRSAGADGSVSMQFVVGPDGRPDLRTVEILWATSSPFAKLALEALEHYRYSPLRVEGCAVPSLVIQPFDFHMKPAEPGGGPPPLPAGGR